MKKLSRPAYFSAPALGMLAAFIVVVIAVGAGIGVSSAPGHWYEALIKPPFNPPNWIFAPVWGVLYVLIAVAGWRVFLADPSGIALRIWGGQMVLNWAWTPVWFSLHLPWPAFFIILALFALIIAFIAWCRQRDPVSAWLFVPYAAWVGFAAILNFSIAVLN